MRQIKRVETNYINLGKKVSNLSPEKVFNLENVNLVRYKTHKSAILTYLIKLIEKN